MKLEVFSYGEHIDLGEGHLATWWGWQVKNGVAGIGDCAYVVTTEDYQELRDLFLDYQQAALQPDPDDKLDAIYAEFIALIQKAIAPGVRKDRRNRSWYMRTWRRVSEPVIYRLRGIWHVLRGGGWDG
jgi:hypothetical protein